VDSEIEVGDIVEVKGLNGPRMIVTESDKQNRLAFDCFWFDKNDCPHSASFFFDAQVVRIVVKGNNVG